MSTFCGVQREVGQENQETGSRRQGATWIGIRRWPFNNPRGRLTCQRLGLPSISRMSSPVAGGWEAAVSRIKKSGPSWETRYESPARSRVISTIAEWPELLLVMTSGVIPENVVRYASRNQLKIGERLGFGIHGFVVSAEKENGFAVAVKWHFEESSFSREVEVMSRLGELGVVDILGFAVPQLLGVDEELRIIEMTVVSRPFVLDFAGGVFGF